MPDVPLRPSTKAKQRLFLNHLIARVDRRAITWAELSTELKVLRRQLHNRVINNHPLANPKPISPPTWTVRQRILELLAERPRRSQEEISRIVGVSIGRVNEIDIGKRV